MSAMKEIAFVDRAIPEAQTFLAGLRPDVEGIVLDGSRPAPAQIASALKGRDFVAAVHIVAHGAPGAVTFSAGALDLATLPAHAADLAAIGGVLGDAGRLYLWCCRSGAGERGEAFVDAVAHATGVAVAAAAADVGSPALGGTWDLDAGARANATNAPLTRDAMSAYRGLMVNIDGTSGPDFINDTGGDDTIRAFGGNDVITVTAGSDGVNGGGGSDRLIVSWSATIVDTFSGGLSGSLATGYFGSIGSGSRFVGYNLIEHFTLLTGSGNDFLIAGDGNDVVQSGAGNDSIQAGNGNNHIDAGTGDDTVNAGAGTDMLEGGDGIDALTAELGGASNNMSIDLATQSYTTPGGSTIGGFERLQNFNSGNGNDTIITRAEAYDDSVNTGGGNDSITVVDGSESVAGGTGRDRLILNWGASANDINSGGLSGSLEDGYFGSVGGGSRFAGYSGIEDFTLNTGGGNDNLLAADGDDIVTSGAGNDSINTRDGNNTVNAGAGDDTVNAGADHDNLEGGDGIDALTAELGGESSNMLINLATHSYTTPGGSMIGGFERLQNFNSGNGNDTIITRAEAYDDSVHTGGGDDSITVVDGSESVAGGNGRDRLILSWGASTNDINSGGLSGSLQDGYFGSVGGGSRFAGYSGIEDFTLNTGGGNDDLLAGDGNDIVRSGAGNDRINAGNGNNNVNAGPGEDTVNAGADTDTLQGGSGVDALTAELGGASNNMLIDLATQSYTTPGGSTIGGFERLQNFNSGNGNDIIITRAEAYDDSVNTGGGNDSITVVDGSESVAGGTGRDRLILNWGASANDINSGGLSGSVENGYFGSVGGGSRFVGYSGIEDFTLNTGGGNDNLLAGDGNDVVNSGAGDDSINTRDGNNNVNAGAGNDTVNAGAGMDMLEGGDDIDALSAELGGASGNMLIDLATQSYTTPGGSTIGGFERLQNFNSGNGNDTIITHGEAFDDSVNTGGGDDSITVVNGSESVSGGTGRDRLILDWTGALVDVTSSGLSGSLQDGYFGSHGGGSRFVGYSGIEDFTLNTGGGNDFLRAGDGNDVVNSGGGNDNIHAADGNNHINAGAGNDTVNAGAGMDMLEGGDDIDALSAELGGASGNMVIDLATQSYATPGGSTIGGFERLQNFNSGNGNDTIITHGEAFDDSVNTGGGDDSITVVNGSESVSGGTGRDRLILDWTGAPVDVTSSGLSGSLQDGYFGSHGGGSRFVGYSGIEDFTLNTGGGNDFLWAGDGNDIVESGAGNDNVETGDGNDVLDGGAGDDTLDGGAGTMDLASYHHIAAAFGGITATIVNGMVTVANDGHGTSDLLPNIEGIDGSQGNDSFTAGAGTQWFSGGAGNDSFDGGAGLDGATYFRDPSAVTINLGTQSATDGWLTGPAPGSPGSDSLLNVENAIGSRFNDTIFGGNPANMLDGGDGDDSLSGVGGNDVLLGGLGADVLNGGAGADIMNGGGGNDVFFVNVASDNVQEGADAGIDTVRSAVGYSLGANVENLALIPTAGDIDGFGNVLDNVITGTTGVNRLFGGDGNDNLNGGAGADQMIGGAGDDTYAVDDAGDLVQEGVGGSGTDTVRSTISYTLGGPIENLILLTGAMNGTGNNAGNTITGNNLANTLDGGGGNDILDGGGGLDNLIGGAGSDTFIVGAQGEGVVEDPGQGIDLVMTGVSYSLGANLENLTLTGSADVNGTGNALNNVLTGNAGSNTLRGNEGNDILDGGTGADALFGGAGGDLYIVDNAGDTAAEGVGGSGVDTVRSSVNFTLSGAIEHLELMGTASTGTGNTLGNTLTGTDEANTLSGLGGNDTLVGRGGADELFGGGGDDTLMWDIADAAINGGAGNLDSLLFEGGDTMLAYSAVISEIEHVNMSGSGDNAFTLSLADVLAFSSTTDDLRIDGDAGDVLALTGGGWVDGGSSSGYHLYTQSTASVLVADAVLTTI